VRVKIAQILVVFTLVCAIGWHWTILQSIAWVNMVVSYSQNSTLPEAFVKTFDGKHPCRICKVVEKGKQSEKKQLLLKTETKIDFWLGPAAFALAVPPSLDICPVEPVSYLTRSESPPTPPPRLA
jgi:hypothetical protein